MAYCFETGAVPEQRNFSVDAAGGGADSASHQCPLVVAQRQIQPQPTAACRSAAAGHMEWESVGFGKLERWATGSLQHM